MNRCTGKKHLGLHDVNFSGARVSSRPSLTRHLIRGVQALTVLSRFWEGQPCQPHWGGKE